MNKKLKQEILKFKSPRPIDKIIVHCAATPEGKEFTVEDIRNWHVNGNGWNDIGYHYVIYLDGSIHEGRGLAHIGAHCTGYNTGSIGICYIGGLAADGKTAKDTRTLKQKASLITLINVLRERFPGIKVYGHHDFDKGKACPCFDAKKEYNK